MKMVPRRCVDVLKTKSDFGWKAYQVPFSS